MKINRKLMAVRKEVPEEDREIVRKMLDVSEGDRRYFRKMFEAYQQNPAKAREILAVAENSSYADNAEQVRDWLILQAGKRSYEKHLGELPKKIREAAFSRFLVGTFLGLSAVVLDSEFQMSAHQVPKPNFELIYSAVAGAGIMACAGGATAYANWRGLKRKYEDYIEARRVARQNVGRKNGADLDKLFDVGRERK